MFYQIPFILQMGLDMGGHHQIFFTLVMEPLAAAITSNPLITGNNIANCSHEIRLFADDVIFTLTYLAPSLTEVQKEI